MKRRTTSTSRLILDNVVALASEQTKRGAGSHKYSSAIELGLSEMVRECMRKMAQSRIPPVSGMLLESALEESFGRVKGELQRAKIHLPLDQYRGQIKKMLKPVAGEMEKLTERLAHARQTGKLADEEVVATGAHTPYEVRPIGLRGLTEGLLVQPIGDDIEIDLDSLPEGCTVRGDWYPFEVQYEDILFVLDDDGSIFVSVENFPEREAVRVRDQLHELARRIYGRERRA
jgi:hypothetical protein